MVKNVSATAGADFIELEWSAPKLLPMSYQVDVACRLLYNGIEYKRERLEATPLDTIQTVQMLHPRSHCVYTLLAIYNPASIDDGITGTIFTLNTSMCTVYTPCACIMHMIIQTHNILYKATFFVRWFLIFSRIEKPSRMEV